MQVANEDTHALAADRELYLADQDGATTSVAEVQAYAYRLGAERALHTAGVAEMRRLLTQIGRAHSSGLPRSTRERIAAVLA